MLHRTNPNCYCPHYLTLFTSSDAARVKADTLMALADAVHLRITARWGYEKRIKWARMEAYAEAAPQDFAASKQEKRVVVRAFHSRYAGRWECRRLDAIFRRLHDEAQALVTLRTMEDA